MKLHSFRWYVICSSLILTGYISLYATEGTISEDAVTRESVMQESAEPVAPGNSTLQDSVSDTASEQQKEIIGTDLQQEGASESNLQEEEKKVDVRQEKTAETENRPAVDVSTTKIQDVENDNAATEIESKATSAKYNGIGFNFGILLFFPGEINDLISDMYEDLKRDYLVLTELGEPKMFLGFPLKLKGVFYLNPYLGIEPYGQVHWAGKYLTVKVSGAADESAWVHFLFFSGGVNCWLRLSPHKRVSFKLGAGGFGGYSLLVVTGDRGDMTLGGAGYGGNVLAGLDITLGKVAINMDFTVPIGMINYDSRDGGLSFYGRSGYPGNYTYPEKVMLVGFEFRPGLTIKF